MSSTATNLPLGYFLKKRGLIDEQQLQTLLKLQANCGSPLGQVAVSYGLINYYQLHQALAEHYGLEFVDIITAPCDKDMLHLSEISLYLEHQAIPWQRKGKKVIVALASLDPESVKWVKSRFPNCTFVITTPFDIRWNINQNFFSLSQRSQEIEREPSAKQFLSKGQKVICLTVLLAAFILFLCSNNITFTILILLANFCYFLNSIFKAIIFFQGADHHLEIISPTIPENELPLYTILIALNQEEAVISKLIKAIRNLDYPKAKLQILLLVEEYDQPTIEAIKKLNCERNLEIVIVPAGSPLTKARALNFGLKFVRGKYLTVYDAEDIPHPSQLKIMVEQFSQAGDEIACLQAKLGMFNQKENLLTKYFAIEYSIWFDFILPGLERTKLLQPLGGTSNHFITSKLKQIGGWDAYNVTEDADLGVRLALHNYRIKMIESVTLEEAPIYVGNWLRQRSRWIKGYIQTYFVHMRDYKNLYNKLKLRGFLSFQLLLGLPNLIFLFNPLMWAIYCSYQFGIGHNEIYLYKYLARFWEFNFLFSYFSSLAYAFTSIRRNNWANSWWNFIIFPFYYSLHNIASIKSFWQLLTNPHYWEKTTHGETALNPSDK